MIGLEINGKKLVNIFCDELSGYNT